MKERQTVLIVDDDRNNRAILAEVLQDQCRVVLAKTGTQALAILEREDVSLVLLDVSMPEMDGYEVLRRIRETPRIESLGVIFITGLTDVADEEKGLLMGAADYVSKPIRPAIVRARVNVHLSLARQRRQLEQLSQRDALTGIANRRSFDQAFERALSQASRSGQPLALGLIDVDHFKEFNDFYGHGAGDDALRAVASMIEDHARRPGDMAARYGGEEFVLLLPLAHEPQAIFERLREAIEGLAIAHQRSSVSDHLSISCGAILAWPQLDTQPRELLERADALLYGAKKAGRNRVLFERLD